MIAISILDTTEEILYRTVYISDRIERIVHAGLDLHRSQSLHLMSGKMIKTKVMLLKKKNILNILSAYTLYRHLG